MIETRDEAATIRRYLLGEMSDEERTRFEQSYMEDDDLFEELRTFESGLIDRYVGKELSDKDRALFERHFLNSSARRRQIELAQALHDMANEPAGYAERAGETASGAGPVSASAASWWRRLIAAIGTREGAGFGWAPLGAAACACLALAAGLIWMSAKNSELRQQLELTVAERLTLKRREEELLRDKADLEVQAGNLNQKLEVANSQQEKFEEALNNVRSRVPIVSSFDLPFPPLSESSAAFTNGAAVPAKFEKVVKVPQGSDYVKLRWNLVRSSYTSYGVELRRMDAPGAIWVPKSVTRRANRLSVNIPSGFLKPGTYMLRLRGVAPSGEERNIVEYLLKVEKR